MPSLHPLALATLLIGALAMTVPSPSPTPDKPTPTRKDNGPQPSDLLWTPRPFPVKYGNDTYQACGNFRGRGMVRCSDDFICIDNPDPSSCGQACDSHGVCVSRKAASCGRGFAPCADNGRCRVVIGTCSRCPSLCFPDYWDGVPDTTFMDDASGQDT